jgi:integrase
MGRRPPHTPVLSERSCETPPTTSRSQTTAKTALRVIGFPTSIRHSPIFHVKPSFPPRLLKHRASGVVRVRIYTPRGAQWLSTGQTSYKSAREVCTKGMIDELQMAACAGVLTADAISRMLTGRRFTCADIHDAWKQEAMIDLAPDTFNAYEVTLRQWMEFCECARKPLSAVPRRDLDGYVNEPDVAAGTRRGRLAALRSYFKFASASGYCVGNPAERIKVKVRDLLFAQLEPKETIPITEEEYRALMASPKLRGFYRFATALGWWLGFRLRDVACMELDSLRGETIVIYAKKTGARLEMPLSDPLIGGGELHRILLEIVEQASDSKFCFPDKREIAIDPKRRANLSVAYQRILTSQGIVGKRFHGLRHAHAMRLKEAGRTLEQIAGSLGHGSTQVTQTYTDHA